MYICPFTGAVTGTLTVTDYKLYFVSLERVRRLIYCQDWCSVKCLNDDIKKMSYSICLCRTLLSYWMWTWVPSAGWRLSVYRVLGRILVAWRSSVRSDATPSTHVLVIVNIHPQQQSSVSVFGLNTESVYRINYYLRWFMAQSIFVCLEIIIIISSTDTSCFLISVFYSLFGY